MRRKSADTPRAMFTNRFTLARRAMKSKRKSRELTWKVKKDPLETRSLLNQSRHMDSVSLVWCTVMKDMKCTSSIASWTSGVIVAIAECPSRVILTLAFQQNQKLKSTRKQSRKIPKQISKRKLPMWSRKIMRTRRTYIMTRSSISIATARSLTTLRVTRASCLPATAVKTGSTATVSSLRFCRRASMKSTY